MVLRSPTTPYSSPSMADIKVTKMVMKVDLQCSKCYRKIKKVLCCYPQIRDQMYDEKRNMVTITVVCCSPENIKEKIARKAGDTVESIEIVPDKTNELEKPKLKPVINEPIIVPVKPLPGPVPTYPLVVYCCCYQGWPCYHVRGPMCYDGNRGYYVSRCEEYFSEENATGCSVM